MTTYCYDTEFLEDGATIDLISIGIVAEDGREYYAINADCDFKRIKEHDWLVRNVVSSLPVTNPAALAEYLGHNNHYPTPSISHVDLDRTHGAVKPKWVIANEVRDFLLAPIEVRGADGELRATFSTSPKLWAYYSAYDHVALAQLFGPMSELPDGIPMWTHDLMFLLEQRGLQAPPPPPGVHNALIDARWNMDLLRNLFPLEYPTREKEGTPQ